MRVGVFWRAALGVCLGARRAAVGSEMPEAYVSQALANSFSVDGDPSVRAVRIMLNGENSVLTVAWSDDPASVAASFAGDRSLDPANVAVVEAVAAALQSDGAMRRQLLEWSGRVDEVLAPRAVGEPLFEIVVAQGYGALAVSGGATASALAAHWCAEHAVSDSECYFVAATICREAETRGVDFGPVAAAARPRVAARTGDVVSALWPSDGRFYRATVGAVGADGRLEVLYEDGDYRTGVDPADVRRLDRKSVV